MELSFLFGPWLGVMHSHFGGSGGGTGIGELFLVDLRSLKVAISLLLVLARESRV